MQTRYLRALIAIGTISAIAGASFFVANRLSTNQSVAPNAPDSNPQAYLGNTKGGPRLADEDIRDIQRGINGSTSNPPRTNNPTRTILRDDEYEEAYQRPTVKSTPKPTAFQTPQNTGGGSGANPSAIKTPTPNKPAPTPTFVSGTFGYQATDEQRKNQNSYMSDANNDCDDGQGFISGTGCFNGKRRVLGLPDTQRAYQQALVKAQNEITNKSDEELLQLSGKNCPPTDNKCKETAIADATNQLLKANAVVLVEDKKKISDTRTVNQATQDILFATDEQFKIKYGTENRQTGFEQLLAKLGVTKESLGIEVDTSKLVASREVLAKYSDPNVSLGTLRTEYCKTTNDPTCLQDFKREDILNNLQLPSEYKTSLITAYKAEATKGEKITEQTLAFLSNKSDQELAKEFCANSGNKTACERSFEREDLLANNPNPQEIIQMKKDQSFAQMYADPRNSTSDLAKIYCDSLSNPGPKCKDEYNSNAILSLIANPQTKQEAINKRISALSLLIPQVVNGEPVTGIDVETKKEIIKINEDTTYAFWVYVRENSARQHKQNVTTEQLALEFNELVKQNPSALTENLKKYNANPKQYNMSFTTFKFDQEENPLILAQYNQIIKTQPIKGLFENNKIVTWNQASEEYKQQAREIACKEDKSLAIYCNLVNSNSYASVSRTKEQRDAALAQIDAAIANSNKQTAYLQQIYNSRTTDNLLSVNQSNLATVDNPALGDPILQSEIKKAQAAVAREDKMSFFDPKNGFGNMSGTSMSVPTSVREALPEASKLTDQEKTDLANEYLRRQLVVETYTRGTGVSGALATATVATIACSGLGFGAAACGAVGGFAGVVSNIIPILGSATAEEIEAERQKIADFVGNDSAATFIQAMYSNQGAASDESLVGGRSQSALNNQYALLDRIHQTNYQTGATTNTLTDPSYQAQLAIQPFLLQQGEELQLENERQAWVNLAVAPVVGAISGGVGGNIANNANRITQGLITSRGSSQVAAALLTGAKDQAVDAATWFMGTLLNDYQTSLQFDSTVSYLDTQSEINLEICNRTQGSNSAECRQLAQDVRDENQDARNQTRLQAFVTDATIQLGQTSVSAGTTGLNIIRSSANTNTPNPTRPTTQTVDPNDSTFISSNLSQLLNLSDPRILNSSPNDIDTITYSNYLSSQTIGRPDVPARDNTINFINEKPSVANESIMQGVVMYKNLIEPEFKAKLKEIGFNDTDIEIALKIRETEADILYTNAINERIEQNEAIAGQLRNNPKDQSENLNIKVDQEIMSDYAEFRRQQAEKYVEDAIKAIEAERPSTQPEATVIADTQKEALKAFLAEASNPDRLVPMNPTDITNHLTSLGHSPEDIQSVINKASLPQIKAAIDKVLDFNNRAAQIRKDIANIAPNIQEEINNRIVNQRFDLLNQLTADIPTTPSTDTTSTQSRAIFRPNDDINQEIPGSFNVIGKIPNKEVDGNQVYYKITYLDEKGVETGISNVLPLEDNNPLPLTNDSYTLEFGFLKDGEFTKLTPSGLAGIQTLAMNVSNNYTFGRTSAIDQLKNSMNANTQPVLTDAQRNNSPNNQLREAIQSLWNRFIPPIDPNTTYGRFISQRQNLNTTYFPETEQIYQILPDLTRDLIQDTLNTPRGQRALTRINDNNQVAHEIDGNRIQYTRRGQNPDTLAFFTTTSINSLDSQIFYYAKSLGIDPNGKSIPEIITLIKEKTALTNTTNNTPSQAPRQPETANLSDTINRYANDTRIVRNLGQINDNFRVVFNDVVGDANNADAKFVRFAQEDLGIDVSGKTMQQIASEVKTKQDQARTIPPTATITEVDKDGNLKYTVEGLSGVTLIADKNSPEAVAINKQDPANFINKKAADISIDIISRSPIDKLTDNPNLPSSLKGDIATKFDSEQIADFNAKLADPNYKPKESPLVKIIRKIGLKPQETTPEITLLNKAASLTELDRNDPTKPPKPYNTTDKSLAQIAADIRAVENQFGNNKNLTALTKEQLLKSLEYLPRRLVQGIAEALKISPNAKVVRVDVPRNEHRYIGAKYMHKNQEWSDFLVQTKQKLDNIPDSQMPQSRKDAIVAGIEDLFISHLKSSIVKANPDFKISPKAIDQDTFIDLNPSRKESLELLKRYFNDFDLEIADIINQVNKVLEGGNTLRIIEDGQYVDVQLQKDWGLKLSLSDLRPSKFVFMGLSLDPKVDSYFNIVNNKEAYFIANGANNEILNAVFMFKILDEPNVNLDDTFPVIEQVQRSNDPDTITHHDEVKDFTLYGKPLNKNEIELLPESGLIGRQETNHQTYLASLAEDIIRKLANYNYDSGVAADGLVAQLDIPNRKRAENAIGSAPIEMVFKEGTDLSFNNTTIVSRNTSQVANDIAGFTLTTDTLTNITRDLPPADKEEYFEGFHIIYGTVQNEGTVLMHGLADIKTYEHAGDGFRGTLDGKLNLEAIKKLVDYSSIYQRTLDDAMNGKLGPKAQKTALALFNALGDKVYLKVGIGTGDTLFQYLPGNIEVKSSVNVDEYLNNVKKYINQEKDAKRIPPKEIIGVSKSISDQFSDQDLATVGLRKIVIEKFEGDKTAYFITKLSNDSLNSPTAPALSLEQSARQQSALRYVAQNYNLLDTDLTTILKNLGYNDLEVEYALLARNLPEIQRVIGELKQFDFRANLEMNEALLMILEVGPDYDVESVKIKLDTQRKELFNNQFAKAQSVLSGSGKPNSSRPAPESNNNTIKSTVKSRMDQILYPAQQMNSLLFPDIIEIFRPRQTINIPNNNSPITIKNIELIMSPEKNQQFLSSIDTTDQFSSLYNRSTIYYDKNGQIVGFGDISKLHPKTQESILSGQYFKTTMLIPKDGTKKYMIAEVQGSKNIVAHKIITETIGLLNNKETAIALLTQTGKLDNVILRQRVALRRFVSGLIGALVGIKVDENYNEEIKQGFDSFFNTKMSTATLGPVGYNNEQSQTTQQSDIPKTITPTLQNSPTPTPKPNRINEDSDSNTRLTSSYNAIIACEQTNKNLTGPRGTQMQLCYCQQVGSDTGVCDTQETKYTSERIRHFYNNNLEYKDENLIFMILPLLDISTLPQFEYTNYLDEDNTSTCKENRICNTRGEEKYAICKLDEIPGIHPTDIVVTNSGKIHLCPKSWGTDLESNAICNQSPYIDPNTNQITYQELKLKPDEIKEVWRSSDYIDTFPGCWAN